MQMFRKFASFLDVALVPLQVSVSHPEKGCRKQVALDTLAWWDRGELHSSTSCPGRRVTKSKGHNLLHVLFTASKLQACKEHTSHSQGARGQCPEELKPLFVSWQETSFVRSISMNRQGGSNHSSSSTASLSQLRQPGEERRALCKGPSTSSWQPWTPVPQPEGKQPTIEEAPGQLRDSVFVPAFTERDMSTRQGKRVRHKSEPQHLKEKPFTFNLDDENIRTSDV